MDAQRLERMGCLYCEIEHKTLGNIIEKARVTFYPSNLCHFRKASGIPDALRISRQVGPVLCVPFSQSDGISIGLGISRQIWPVVLTCEPFLNILSPLSAPRPEGMG